MTTMRKGKTERDRHNRHDGIKTGHCPFAGKESEKGSHAVRAYLDALPGRSRPPRGKRTSTPQQDSRAAVQRRMEERERQ